MKNLIIISLIVFMAVSCCNVSEEATFNMDEEKDKGTGIKTVFINAQKVEEGGDSWDFEEGCLSIPDLRAEVIRPKSIFVSFFDVNMKEHTIEADELFARVIQHEYDHLQGVLFIDYFDDEMKKRYKKHLEKIKKRKLDIDYPISSSTDYLIK